MDSRDQRFIVGVTCAGLGLGVGWAASLHARKRQEMARERRQNAGELAIGTTHILLYLELS